MPAPSQSPPTGEEPKHRYECPAGHKSWERINSHAWCHACSQELASGGDADPEWHELRDTKTDEVVAFEQLREQWPEMREVSAY